jgi:hypothetical protein
LTLAAAIAKLTVPYNEPPITLSSFTSPSTPDPLNIVRLSGAPSVTHLYGQLMALASVLYHQIGYQLSVGYGGQHRQRGAYFDMIWVPLGSPQYLARVFAMLRGGMAGATPRDAALVRRFTVALEDRLGTGRHKVLWYASFGDERGNELPGAPEPPTRPIPVCRVLPPHRPLETGEDPIYFERPLTEFLDCSNDDVMRDIHDGLIPREWRSYIEPIWSQSARFAMTLRSTSSCRDAPRQSSCALTRVRDLSLRRCSPTASRSTTTSAAKAHRGARVRTAARGHHARRGRREDHTGLRAQDRRKSYVPVCAHTYRRALGSRDQAPRCRGQALVRRNERELAGRGVDRRDRRGVIKRGDTT